jgi:hypothetical protein
MMEEQPHAETKPRKPGRITRRTLGVILVLIVAVWGAAIMAGPRPPFRFLEGMKLAQPPDRDTYESGTIYYYVGRSNYRELYNRAKSELYAKGWKETWAGVNDKHWKVMFYKDSPEAPAGNYSMCLIQDLNWRGRLDENAIEKGWNTVYATLEKPPSTKWDNLWSRVREALHL